MVILQKIFENKMPEKDSSMGNRGSKSAPNVISYKRVLIRSSNVLEVVKEQRADGGYICNRILRCVLMGFERNHQVNNLSHKINKVRWYTSITSHKPTVTPQSIQSPWFITGFSDAESSFSILIQANSKYTTGWRIKPVFAIGLHKKDFELLKNIQSYLGVGKIHVHGKDSIQYRVDSNKDLQVLVNHFDKYPLVTAKLADFILFKKAFDIILLKKHLSQEGLLKLVGIKASLNLGLSADLKEAFPNWNELQIKRPHYTFKGIPDSNWMAGFASGDSSFNIKVSDSNTNVLGQRVQLRFGIGLNIREEALIQYLASYFGLTGSSKNVYIHKDSVRFEIVNFLDIVNKIIPFFEKHLIQGKKSLDFICFKEVAGIIQRKDHLTPEGFQKILKIKARMNE